MSRSAERIGAARVAIVGATSVVGSALREALAARRIAGSRVDLYGAITEAPILSEYDGEARIVQAPDLEEIGRHDLIFLCETGSTALRISESAPATGLVVDLVGALGSGADVPLFGEIGDAVAGADGTMRVAIAHPIAALVAGWFRPQDRAFGVSDASAVVFRPAADWGEAGTDELRRQTTSLLGFAELPIETFGHQLAFNLIPESLTDAAASRLAPRISTEVARLLGWGERGVAVRLIAVPLFYGHAMLMRFRLARAATVAEILAVAAADGWLPPGADRPRTPLEVVGESVVSIGELEPDGQGGYWAWIVSGDLVARSVREAIELAESAREL